MTTVHHSDNSLISNTHILQTKTDLCIANWISIQNHIEETDEGIVGTNLSINAFDISTNIPSCVMIQGIQRTTEWKINLFKFLILFFVCKFEHKFYKVVIKQNKLLWLKSFAYLTGWLHSVYQEYIPPQFFLGKMCQRKCFPPWYFFLMQMHTMPELKNKNQQDQQESQAHNTTFVPSASGRSILEENIFCDKSIPRWMVEKNIPGRP